MPKQRSSDSVGNRSSADSRSSDSASGGTGGGVAGLNGLAELIQERFQGERTVNVEVPSRTRGRDESLEVVFTGGSGIVQVHSESGQTYNVDAVEGSCDCQHYQHRQEQCRHMDAVEIAQGNNPELRNMIDNINTQEELENVASRDIDEEEARRAMSGDREDDGIFYVDDISGMENRMSEMRSEAIPYDYVNALNGSNVTFGIELEFVNGNSSAIAIELHRMGIVGEPRMVHYGATAVPGKWKVERDSSVTSGSRGGELVSPVLRDTPETWRQIETICEVAKRHGAKVSTKTGGHVHIGVEPLDTARQRWRRFFDTIKGNEETIYNFSGGDLGEFRGGTYANSYLSEARRGSWGNFTMEEMGDVRRLASDLEVERNRGINLRNLAQNSQDTVEFRYFNGSVTPGQIQANVKLAVGIMHSSEKSRTQLSDEFQVSENDMRRGRLIRSGDNSKDVKSIARLIDIAFTRQKDKEHALSVFSRNKFR